MMTFKLAATVSSENPDGVRVPLDARLGSCAKVGRT